MRFRQYLKDHWILFLCLFFAMLLISCLLLIMRLSGEGILFINLLVWMFLLIAILIDFIRKKKFYDNVMHHLETLDKKYLLHELLEPPHFAEGDILCEVLYQCNKSMADEVSVYRNHSKEYREYIETWVHEIKTPIASASLVYENNKTPATQSMYEEILNIENFVEQSLYYARSSYVEKDYAIKSCNLKDMVATTLKQHSKQLIENKTAIEMKQLDVTVFTDSKWVQFILGQLILNATKYQSPKRPLRLTFAAEKEAQHVSLLIQDNGSGIAEQDIGRVFEQGFTGENGRNFAKSTGMGLFICKKLCGKLGLSISLDSVLGQGTTVTITFPVGNMHLLED